MDAMEYWRKHKRKKCQALCEQVGTTYPYWKQIAHGLRRPSIELARAFVEASQGEMTLDCLLKPKQRQIRH